MGLINNHHLFGMSLVKTSGGVFADARSNFNKSECQVNRFAGKGFNTRLSSIPNGYQQHAAWAPARTSGGIAATTGLRGSGSVTDGNLAGGRNAEATLSGVGEITQAIVALIVQATANLSGAGSVDASISGVGSIEAALDGVGQLTSDVEAIAYIESLLAGSGSVDASIRADAYVSATITPFTALSPVTLAEAVWNSVITSSISQNLTAADILKIVLAVQAGKSTVVDLGAGHATVVFRDPADTKDVVSAEMNASERVTIVLNP